MSTISFSSAGGAASSPYARITGAYPSTVNLFVPASAVQSPTYNAYNTVPSAASTAVSTITTASSNGTTSSLATYASLTQQYPTTVNLFAPGSGLFQQQQHGQSATTTTTSASTAAIAAAAAVTTTTTIGAGQPSPPALVPDHVWEQDLQLHSEYLDKKDDLLDVQEKWMKEQHPEMEQVMADFMMHVLQRKPDDLYTAAADYFASFADSS